MTQWKYYHAPMTIFHALEADEIPRLLNTTGHIFIPPPSPTQSRFDEEERIPRIDLALIKQLGLRMCVGKESDVCGSFGLVEVLHAYADDALCRCVDSSLKEGT